MDKKSCQNQIDGSDVQNNEESPSSKKPKMMMTMEEIEASMKQMLEEVKQKRENDANILEEVKKEIMAQATRCCELLEQHMNTMQTAKSKEINEKQDALTQVLNRIKESEAEMAKTKCSLSLLCKEVSEA